MKTALFTGIGRLGVPVVEHLVDQGWQVAISYRPGRTSEKTVQKLIDDKGADRVKGIAAEVVKPAAAVEFVHEGIEALGHIDALINIASNYPSEKDHWQRWQHGGGVTDADWDYYDSNFTLYRNVIEALLEQQDDCAGLSIINFGDARSMQFFDESICDPYEAQGGILTIDTEQAKAVGLARIAQIAPPRQVNPYTLAKIDVACLTRKLALDLGGRQIRVNTIALGPMIPAAGAEDTKLDIIANQTCLNKWGGTDPVVQAVEFLLNNDYVTGETLKVDGGLYLHQRFGK